MWSVALRPSFTAMKNSNTITAFSRCVRYCFRASSTKYNVRKPRMANIMALYTISGSRLTAMMAGTESNANITSDSSTTATHSISGVA
ncbi:hypothetical protein D3C75_1083630 [compost metagenome]